jgi:hypothetical protein
MLGQLRALSLLATHAKRLFLSSDDPRVSAGAARCDTLLGDLEVFQRWQLYSEETVSTAHFGLLDMRDATRSRALVDRLLEEEKMQAALEVAQRCGLESHRVFAHWGCLLIRLGRCECHLPVSLF